jgi:glyoxylate carboligase
MSDFAGTAAAESICEALKRCSAGAAFGLPGGPNQTLFQRLRGTDPRLIVPTHELAAAFMAGTYGRIDGRPGILLTIPGPGFAFALPGIAEAWQDSAPLVHIVAAAPGGPHLRHRHQALDQNAIARALTKAMFAVSDPARLGETVSGYRPANRSSSRSSRTRGITNGCRGGSTYGRSSAYTRGRFASAFGPNAAMACTAWSLA